MPAAEWESNFTQVVVANIAAARKAAGEMTIDQFARRCDEVIGEPGRFKPNTLQGLFVGKRKTVSVSELVVFAEALDVPLLTLLVPQVEGVRLPEVSGRGLTPLDVWTLATGAGESGRTESGREARHDLEQLDVLALGLMNLRSSLAAFRYLDPDYDPGDSKLLTPPAVLLEEIRGSLRECRQILDRYPEFAGRDDPFIEWVRRATAGQLTVESLVTIGRELMPYESYRDALEVSERSETNDDGQAADTDQ